MNESTMPDQGMNPAEATAIMDGEAPQGQGQGQARKQGGNPEAQGLYQQAAAQQSAPQMSYPPQQPYPQMPYPYGYAAQPVYGQASGMGQMRGQYAAPTAAATCPTLRSYQMVQDMTSGTPGLSSLTKLIDFDDKDF